VTDYIFGIRAVIEAIKAEKEIDKLFIKKGLKGDLVLEMLTLVHQNKIQFQYVPVEKINRITRKNHQGVVAFISPITYQLIEQIVPIVFEKGEAPLILALDGITDVRNFGAIARSAECAGVHAIVVPTKGGAQINSDAMKTSAGALLKIPVCRVPSLRNTLMYLKNSGLKIVIATEKTHRLYFDADFKTPTVIVMGAEDTGVSTENLKIADEAVKIPTLGEIESLNVSAACTVLLYEAVRQRQ